MGTEEAPLFSPVKARPISQAKELFGLVHSNSEDLATEAKLPTPEMRMETVFDVGFGQGGFLLGYESPRMGILSVNAEMRFGFGSFEANRDLGENIYEIYRDQFTQFTPRIALAITPFNMIQIRLYGGYAFHSDVDLGTLDFDPNRPEFGLSLYWGWFE